MQKLFFLVSAILCEPYVGAVVACNNNNNNNNFIDHTNGGVQSIYILLASRSYIYIHTAD